MSEAIKVGDVVCLKTGGCPMTVEAIEGWKAVCVWTDHARNFRESYPLLVLRPNDGSPTVVL
jgi:uncharacterized protein YodC (DUF2158 family)